MDKELLEVINLSGLFSGLSEEHISSLLIGKAMNVAEYKRNDILFWTDEPIEKLYVLIAGNIALARDTQSGKRSLSKSITQKGDITGEVRLFSEKKLLWEYAVAIEDTTVLEIGGAIFTDPCATSADIQLVLLRNIIANVVDKIDKLGQKVSLLSTPSVRGRIVFYLFHLQGENQRIFLTQTREEMADYLGIARPSLSRELGRMQSDGIIEIFGHEVKILNQHAFDALLE